MTCLSSTQSEKAEAVYAAGIAVWGSIYGTALLSAGGCLLAVASRYSSVRRSELHEPPVRLGRPSNTISCVHRQADGIECRKPIH